MFRASPAPIIGNTKTVVTTTGTGREFEWILFNRILSLIFQIHDMLQRL